MKKKLFLTSILSLCLLGCTKSTVENLNTTNTTNSRQSIENTLWSEEAVAIYKKTIDSTYEVQLLQEGQTKWQTIATAFAVEFKGKKFILTAKHVVKIDGKLRIKSTDNKLFDVTKFSEDEFSDSAVMYTDKTDYKLTLKVAPKNPEIGTDCWAIGNPLGFTGVISNGIISQFDDSDGQILATTHIAPGNSGGPLLNKECNVIGISSAVILQHNSINFFVSTKQINNFLDKELTKK